MLHTFCQPESFSWISLTGSNLLSSAALPKLFFFKVHNMLAHTFQQFYRSVQKKCHRHVHSSPATTRHSATHLAIGSQSSCSTNPFSTNFRGKLLVSKRRWPRCTNGIRLSRPSTVGNLRRKAPKTLTQARAGAQRSPKTRVDGRQRPAVMKKDIILVRLSSLFDRPLTLFGALQLSSLAISVV